MGTRSMGLFDALADRSDPKWIAKRYFDEIYESGDFIEVVTLLAKRWGCITDDVGCRFPDMESYFQEDHFEGVWFAFALPLPEFNEIIVSDVEFAVLLDEACSRYLALHPSDAEVIATAMSELSTWLPSA